MTIIKEGLILVHMSVRFSKVVENEPAGAELAGWTLLAKSSSQALRTGIPGKIRFSIIQLTTSRILGTHSRLLPSLLKVMRTHAWFTLFDDPWYIMSNINVGAVILQNKFGKNVPKSSYSTYRWCIYTRAFHQTYINNTPCIRSQYRRLYEI